MDFKILHLSSGRARVRADFRLTPDVKVYLKKRAAKIENIKKVDFYKEKVKCVPKYCTNKGCKIISKKIKHWIFDYTSLRKSKNISESKHW